jgi:hypothetical protein
MDSVMLQCCNVTMPIEVTCLANPRCADADLIDACCPTKIGKYLDCCNVVPDECHSNNNTTNNNTTDNGNNSSSVQGCDVISVAEYKELNIQGSISSAASSWWLCQWTVAAVVLAGGWMAAV